MDEPLDELYFTWLYRQVASVRLKSLERTHWSLFRQMHCKEFVWFVPNDDNRVEDGRDLRQQFENEEGILAVDLEWQQLGCSFLEMMVALSRRLAFEMEGKASWWFFHLLDNLGVNVADAYYNDENEEIIDEVLDRVIWRTYSHDGSGGLFPLQKPAADQREVEIWYQFNAYLLEQFD